MKKVLVFVSVVAVLATACSSSPSEGEALPMSETSDSASSSTSAATGDSTTEVASGAVRSPLAVSAIAWASHESQAFTWGIQPSEDWTLEDEHEAGGCGFVTLGFAEGVENRLVLVMLPRSYEDNWEPPGFHGDDELSAEMWNGGYEDLKSLDWVLLGTGFPGEDKTELDGLCASYLEAASASDSTAPTTSATPSHDGVLLAEWVQTTEDGYVVRYQISRIWSGPEKLPDAQLPVPIPAGCNGARLDPQRAAAVAVVRLEMTNLTDGFDVTLPLIVPVESGRRPDGEDFPWVANWWDDGCFDSVEFTPSPAQGPAWVLPPDGTVRSHSSVFIPTFYSPASPNGAYEYSGYEGAHVRIDNRDNIEWVFRHSSAVTCNYEKSTCISIHGDEEHREPATDESTASARPVTPETADAAQLIAMGDDRFRVAIVGILASTSCDEVASNFEFYLSNLSDYTTIPEGARILERASYLAAEDNDCGT